MRSNLIARAVFAASIAAGVLLATAVTPAAAREGSARSIGNGIKCRTLMDQELTYLGMSTLGC